jgi:putative membrane protein
MSVRSHMPFFAAIVILCGTAVAQQPPQPSGGNPPTAAPGSPGVNSTNYPGAGPMDSTGGPAVPFSDKAFVKKAAESNTTEVEFGKLAQQKGSTEAVKEFGKRMVEDHSKANQNIAPIAAKLSVDVPSELPHAGKKTLDKLAKLSGADFDRAYVKLMLNDHRDDVNSFTEEVQQGQIPAVKDFANKTLPTLQEHKKMAAELEASTKH